MKSEERIEELCTALRKRQIFAACIKESWRSGNELLQNKEFTKVTVDRKVLVLFLALLEELGNQLVRLP